MNKKYKLSIPLDAITRAFWMEQLTYCKKHTEELIDIVQSDHDCRLPYEWCDCQFARNELERREKHRGESIIH